MKKKIKYAVCLKNLGKNEEKPSPNRVPTSNAFKKPEFRVPEPDIFHLVSPGLTLNGIR